MNTLLPYPDCSKSAEVLDDRRLGRQRSDVLGILEACMTPATPGRNDPKSVKMWRGNEPFLIHYGMAICLEYQSRGNTDGMLPKILPYKKVFEGPAVPPEWWGDEEFHESHRSYLVRMFPSIYEEKFPDVDDDLPMVWPRTETAERMTPEEREQLKRDRAAMNALRKVVRSRREAERLLAIAGHEPSLFWDEWYVKAEAEVNERDNNLTAERARDAVVGPTLGDVLAEEDPKFADDIS